MSDTVASGIVSGQLVHWSNGLSGINAIAEGGTATGGQYQLTWADEPFGLPNGIVLNRSDPAATQAEWDAAVTGRAVG